MENKIINLFDGRQGFSGPKVNYAIFIQQLVEAFGDKFRETENFEDLLEIAITAWNLGNVENLIPTEDKEEVFSMISGGDINGELLREMVAYKVKHFTDYEEFISDYELDEEGGKPNLSVQTQEKDLFLESMLGDIFDYDDDGDYDDEDDEDFEYEENFVNRCAILIKPLPPFVNWLTGLYPDEVENNIEVKATKTYLIHEDIDDIEAWLKKNYKKIFDLELVGWHLDEKEWPQRRSYKMFTQWFQVEISTSVYDLENAPVFKG